MNILLVFTGFIIALIIVLYYECKIRSIYVKPKNKVHFYVARDEGGLIFLYLDKPERRDHCFINSGRVNSSYIATKSYFKCVGLNPDDFKDLKWEDEPVEVFVNMED